MKTVFIVNSILKRMVRPVRNIRNLTKADMKNNNATPKIIDVDPQNI